jgi:hypothetical protein
MTVTDRRRPLQLIESLTARIETLEVERKAAVSRAVSGGATWNEIGATLGVSAQAAHKRYRWLRHSTTTGETWHEPPLPTLSQPPASQILSTKPPTEPRDVGDMSTTTKPFQHKDSP